MATAKKDVNKVSTLLLTSSADGETPINAAINTANHGIMIADGTTGSDLSDDIASRDSNGETVLMGVSETDGVTPTAVYANAADGSLLVDST